MKILGLDLEKMGSQGDPGFQRARGLKEVTIPLKGGFGSTLLPSVDVGEEVSRGTIIARDDGSVSTPIHSSVSGKVAEIVEMEYFHEETLETLPAKIPGVKIERSSKKEEKAGGLDWEEKEPKSLRKLLYLAGLTDFGQTGVPTEFNSSYFSPEDVKKIVVNGVKTVPFVEHLIDYEEEFSPYETGLKIISRAFPHADLHLALDSGTYQGLDSWGSGQMFSVHSVKSKSHMSKPKMLARELFEGGWKSGNYLLDHGVLTLAEIIPLFVKRAIVDGLPLTRTRFSLAGPGTDPMILEAPIGATLGDIIDDYVKGGADCVNIIGDPLSGRKLENLDIPVGKRLDSLVRLNKPGGSEIMAWLRPGLSKHSYSKAFLSTLIPSGGPKTDSGLHGEERPCISCGYCNEICPTGLLPYQLYQTFTHDLVDEVNRLQPESCVDCGLCSYVCPSKLPLSQTIKEAKMTQPGAVRNYVKYEGSEQGLTPLNEKGNQSKRGEKG